MHSTLLGEYNLNVMALEKVPKCFLKIIKSSLVELVTLLR